MMPPDHQPRTRPPLWALAPLVVAGLFLRVWNFDAPVLFMDEIHAIQDAWKNGYGHILTTYELADSCIPLTAWNRLLIDGGGLTEFGIRLPSVVGGCLMLLAIAAFARASLRPAEGVLLSGVVATSPYLVYLSREARPYPIVYALFAVAFLLTMSWLRGAAGWRFILGAFLAAVAMWFHPIVFPALTVLALLPLPGAIRRRDRKYWITYGSGGALFILLVTLLVSPALDELEEQRGIKSGLGTAGLETVERSIDYVHCFAGFELPLWAWGALAAAGLALLARRFPLGTAALCVMLAGQIVLIRQTQPWLAEIPWVGFRYVAHLLPFVFAALLLPIGRLLELLDRTGRRALAPAAGLALVAAFGGAHAMLDHYNLADDGSYNMHPQVMLMTADENRAILEEPIPGKPQKTDVAETVAFYRRLRDELPPGGVIEAPMIFTFPVFEYYRRVHERPIKTGCVPLGRWLWLFSPLRDGLELETTADVQDLRIADHPGFRYVVFHKRLFWEMVLLNAKGEEQPVLGRHTIPYDVMMNLLWEVELAGAKELEPPAELKRRGKLIHEDYWIAVYDMREGE